MRRSPGSSSAIRTGACGTARRPCSGPTRSWRPSWRMSRSVPVDAERSTWRSPPATFGPAQLRTGTQGPAASRCGGAGVRVGRGRSRRTSVADGWRPGPRSARSRAARVDPRTLRRAPDRGHRPSGGADRPSRASPRGRQYRSSAAVAPPRRLAVLDDRSWPGTRASRDCCDRSRDRRGRGSAAGGDPCLRVAVRARRGGPRPPRSTGRDSRRGPRRPAHAWAGSRVCRRVRSD